MLKEEVRDLVALGKAIQDARKNKNLSKVRAAKELEIARLTLDQWENAQWVPKVERVGSIADFTGLDRMQVLSVLLRANGIIDRGDFVRIDENRDS